MKCVVEGLLLIDKPPGPTSHDAVARIRRCLGVRRVGHSGTLDPAARGLLPIVVGSATRLVRFLPHSPKLYRGRLRLGMTTDTDDVTGRVLTRCDAPLPRAELVRDAARTFEGFSRQVPPTYSARKVDGERLHRLARRGTPVTAPAAEVEVASFLIREVGAPDEYEFEVTVSAGTYVRSLVRDLGEALGCGGTLVSLERLRIGPLRLEDALPLPKVCNPEAAAVLVAALIPPVEMPLTPPACRIEDPEQARRFTQGLAVTVSVEVSSDEGLVSVVHCGRLLGVAEPAGGLLRPRVVLSHGS